MSSDEIIADTPDMPDTGQQAGGSVPAPGPLGAPSDEFLPDSPDSPDTGIQQAPSGVVTTGSPPPLDCCIRPIIDALYLVEPVAAGDTAVIRLLIACPEGTVQVTGQPTISIKTMAQTVVLTSTNTTYNTTDAGTLVEIGYLWDTTGMLPGFYWAKIKWIYSSSIAGGPIAGSQMIGIDITA